MVKKKMSDGLLDQDEIDALLGNGSESEEIEDTETQETPEGDGLLDQSAIDALLGNTPEPEVVEDTQTQESPSDDGLLDQSAIDALLGNTSEPDIAEDTQKESKNDDGLLNQDEINALLGDTPESEQVEGSEKQDGDGLSDVEKDTLGEIGNISMGTSATTLFTLLGQKVTITTPKVTVTNIDELSEYYPVPFVAIEVKYKVGLEGLNLLILKVSDVKIIADLMMGGEGKDLDDELTEIDLSAMGEAMNQMVGSSSTSLASMLGQKIDIDPPQSYKIDLQEEKLNVFAADEKIVKISFKMVVGDLIDSEIMQLIPLKFAKDMVEKLIGDQQASQEEIKPQEASEPQVSEQVQQPEVVQPVQGSQPVQPQPQMNMEPQQPQMQQPVQPQQQQYQQPAYQAQQPQQPVQPQPQQQPVNVTTPQFQQFDQGSSEHYDIDIDIIQDIPVEITVQLGKTMRKIGEILEYGPGTIIELDKLLGEPLEIFANDKFIAKGEVVVIEDNFGIRVTEIVSPSKRIRQN